MKNHSESSSMCLFCVVIGRECRWPPCGLCVVNIANLMSLISSLSLAWPWAVWSWVSYIG